MQESQQCLFTEYVFKCFLSVSLLGILCFCTLVPEFIKEKKHATFLMILNYTDQPMSLIVLCNMTAIHTVRRY